MRGDASERCAGSRVTSAAVEMCVVAACKVRLCSLGRVACAATKRQWILGVLGWRVRTTRVVEGEMEDWRNSGSALMAFLPGACGPPPFTSFTSDCPRINFARPRPRPFLSTPSTLRNAVSSSHYTPRRPCSSRRPRRRTHPSP